MVSKIRVFVADDHAVLRAGLRLLIDSQPDMTCVGEAGDGVTTLEQAEATQPDLVLLDLSMPRMRGLAALPEIRRRLPNTRVLVLTMHADEEYLRQCLREGAAGYVLKEAADQELLLAIRAVMRGQVYIHPAMTHAILGDLVDRSVFPGAGSANDVLSEREAEVMKRVARGYTNQEIADQLSLSVKTVETYRSRAMEKLGLSGRSALMRYAIEKGWLTDR